LKKIVEETTKLKENIQNMITVLAPVGCVQAFAGSTTPDGWLFCDGSAVSRTDYKELYSVIGDTYGDGDGSTTFNVPNIVDKFIEGSTTEGTVKSAGLPNITGNINIDPYNGSACPVNQYSGALKANHAETNVFKFQTNGTTSAEYGIALDASLSNSIYGNSDTVQPPSLTMRYIIKY
jgi:microcystin-dependent protein